MADAFYTPTGTDGTFIATPHTEGPWAPGVQHGGPPSALIARTIERLPTSLGQPAQVARVTIEILGPVPLGEVRASARVVRPGRSVELVEAELTAARGPVIRASAWRIRTAALDLPAAGVATEPGLPEPLPESAAFDNPSWDNGFIAAMEWRFIAGRFDEPGPCRTWVRQRVPLVDGEEPTGLQRLMALADCGNGLSAWYDFTAYLFINTELTVHLHRVPVGEWMYAATKSTLDTSGVGLAESVLCDIAGPVGRGAQALLVDRR